MKNYQKTLLNIGALIIGTNMANGQTTLINVDTNKSIVNWEASKVTGKHHGTVTLLSGNISIANEAPTGGTFVVNMKSIANLDLSGDMKNSLETHLKSKDFFEVEKYPTTVFTITKLTPKGTGKYEINGTLTIKDKTNPITFEATANASADGKTLTVKSDRFSIDRTKWNVIYGSGSFFKGLADKAINDDIFFEILLEATIK